MYTCTCPAVSSPRRPCPPFNFCGWAGTIVYIGVEFVAVCLGVGVFVAGDTSADIDSWVGVYTRDLVLLMILVPCCSLL